MALQLSQTLNTERLARTAATPWDRLFYRFETRRMAAYEARLWQDVIQDRADRRAGPRGDRQGLPRARACPRSTMSSGGRTGSTSSGSSRGPASRKPDMVVMSGVMRYAPNVEAALWFAARGLAAGPGRAARRRASSWSAATRPPPAGAGRQGRHHRHRHGRGAGRLDRPGGGVRGPDPRRRRAAEQAARGHGDGQGRGRDPGANEGIRAPDGEAVLLAEEPAPFARGGPGAAGRPGPARSWVRPRGRSSRPNGPGRARSWSWRRRFSPPDPDAASDRRPDFCCTAQCDPLQPAVATPSYCASQQNPEMPPWPSPPFPSSSFPS